MSSIRDNSVSIRGNLKYKTWRILYSLVYVRALHDTLRLKLTWIDCRFMPVRRLMAFERALNSIQHVNLIKFLCTAPEKIVFLYWKGTADEYDDKFTSGCNSIVCLNRRLNVGRTLWRVVYVKNVIPSVVISWGIIRFIGYTRSLRWVLFVLSGILVHYVGYYSFIGYHYVGYHYVGYHYVGYYYVGYHYVGYRARCTFASLFKDQRY